MKKNYSLGEINKAVRLDAKGFVDECTDEFEKRIDLCAGNILSNKAIDIVMLAGPSSSGKTTTANKIAKSIKKRGKNAFIISLDDYYFNREDIAVNSDGLPDYENITAIDIPLVKETFDSLIKNREAILPVFNFSTGRREEGGREIRISGDDVVIVEGIHALNPIITQGLDISHIYKIYISVSSRLTKSDGKILMTKRNIRFVRRMIRDYNFRNSDVENTYFLWNGVRKGEDRFIFPFKGNANEFINSMHPFEACLFKQEAMKLLGDVSDDSAYSDESKRLGEALERFESISAQLLPENSLLHEFIG